MPHQSNEVPEEQEACITAQWSFPRTNLVNILFFLSAIAGSIGGSVGFVSHQDTQVAIAELHTRSILMQEQIDRRMSDINQRLGLQGASLTTSMDLLRQIQADSTARGVLQEEIRRNLLALNERMERHLDEGQRRR